MSINEIQLDIEEARSLLKASARPRLRNLLSQELGKLEIDLKKLEESQPQPLKTSDESATTKKYAVTIRNYSWDQSDRFVKFYISLKGVGTLSPDLISCKFNELSLSLNVSNLDGKDHEFKLTQLSHKINPDQSYKKVKADMVVLYLSKSESKTWGAVTDAEQKILDAKQSKTSKPDTSNPEAGIMNLMQQMYNEGDDEMKRMISKTWYESQNKKDAGLPGM